jgi:sugar phosphate isomerase/epimerase
MKLSIVSDELRIEQKDALPLIAEWGLTNVELRGMPGGRLPDGDVEQVAQLVKTHGMTVTGLSPGCFKCEPDAKAIEKDLDRLRRTLPLCQTFNCDTIIAFSVKARPGQPPSGTRHPADFVVEGLREAGRIAAEKGVRIALENEPGFTAVGARSAAILIDRIGMENVGANWDPGNAWPWDVEIASGPRILGERIFNVHVKDTARRDGERVFDVAGRGSVGWKQQVDQFGEMGYDGAIVVETHFEPGVEKSRENVDILKKWLGL